MVTPTALPAAFTSGQVLTAADQNLLRGGFRVLQVVSASTNTRVINATNVYANTGLTATITPQATTNKILVMFQQNGCGKEPGNSASELNIQLLRTATQISLITGCYTGTSVANYCGTMGNVVLDSPATIAATTYITQFKNTVNAADVRVQQDSTSTIILMEISA